MWVRQIPLITRQVQYINTHEANAGIPLSCGEIVDLQGEDENHIWIKFRHWADIKGEDVYDCRILNEGE